jgi:photosystem II stability/assembly factor-like uncharacterized protein
VAFAGSYGWAVGDVNALFVTSDGGATWQQQELPRGVGGIRKVGFYGITAVDQHNVWSVAGNTERWSVYHGEWSTGGVVLASADGGATWERQGSGPFLNFMDIVFADRHHGWAVGDDPMTQSVAIYRTVDGGATWRPCLERNYDRPFSAVACTDAKHVWAIHCSNGTGIIWRSSDGGKTWSYYARSGLWSLLVGDLSFVDASHGWTVSGWEMRSTSNGGKTWKTLKSPTKQTLRGVSFIDVKRGWVVGENGAVFATLNGGASWRRQDSGTTEALSHVEFVNRRCGWAVGSGGTIIATTDGGSTWRLQRSSPDVSLTEASFLDARRGWVVGDGNNVLVTTDGGSHWTAQATPAVSDLRAVDFVDGTHGWVAGHFGTILAVGQASSGGESHLP